MIRILTTLCHGRSKMAKKSLLRRGKEETLQNEAIRLAPSVPLGELLSDSAEYALDVNFDKHISRPPDTEMLPTSEVLPCDICRQFNIFQLISESGFQYCIGRTSIEVGASKGCVLCGLFLLAIPDHLDTVSSGGGLVGDRQLFLHLAGNKIIPGMVRSDLIMFKNSQGENINGRHGPVGIYTDRGDPAASLLSGRRLPTLSGHHTTLQLIEFWLAQSFLHSSPEKTVVQPKRLIDVGTEKAQDLCLSVDSRERQADCRYICLSHCWAHGNPLRTTTISLPTRTRGIQFEELSKTFQEAVRLTRRLGLRYLWIDSLCIVQDSLLDWEEESAKMGSYYTCSWLTIGAGASSLNHEGLFSERKSAQYSKLQTIIDGKPSKLYFSNAASLGSQQLQSDPSSLNSRGWTLQEQLLPPRFLSFEPAQVCFRDDKYVQYECGRTMQVQHTDFPHRRSFLRPGCWSQLVEIYTHRRLTVPDDRLAALSGLAHEYRNAFGDVYLAGIWKSELWMGLLWRRTMTENIRPGAEARYKAPSWSWAAVDGSIQFASDIEGHRDQPNSHTKCLIQITNVSAEPSGRDPLGRLQGGHLEVQGPVERATYDRINASGLTFIYKESLHRQREWQFYPDEDFVQLPREFLILQITTHKGLAIKENSSKALEPSFADVHGNQIPETYRRVGFVELLEPSSELPPSPGHGQAEDQTLVII